MALFTPLGFDGILESPEVLKDSIAISADGGYSVSSSPGMGTFLEHHVEGGGDPIRLFPFDADVAGFYGRDDNLIAIAHDDTLRIVSLHKMEVIFTVKIRPGGLFVPSSGNSGFIGVVSPKGATYVIEDNGDTHPTSLRVSSEYDVLWSSQAYPAGYTWNDDSAAYIYIRSTPDDEGATISSTQGMNLFTVWNNKDQRRSEAYLTTYDEPHVLKRVWSEQGRAITETVVSLAEGSVVDNVVLFSSGRPVIAAGYHHGRSVAKVIPSHRHENLIPILHSLATNEEKFITTTCMGFDSFVSWTQTPITPAIPSVTNYAIRGIPRYEIKGGRPRYTKLNTGKKVSFTVPLTNTVRSINITNNPEDKIYYRWVSPYPNKGATAETAAIIIDQQGQVSAGEYSPTVKMLYDLNIPVAILPVVDEDASSDDTVLDIIDVAHDILDTYSAQNVCIIAEGDAVPVALRALTKEPSSIMKAMSGKKSPIRNVIAYHAQPEDLTKKVLKKHATTVICDTYEEAENFPEDVFAVVLGNGRQRDIDLMNAVSKAV